MAAEAIGKHIFVIGSGLAGYGVVRELRRRDKTVKITVITKDDGAFYSKPAISTALSKAKFPEQLVTMSPDKMVDTQNIELIKNAWVTAIDVANKQIEVGGETLVYDKLILAIGAQPIRPKFAQTCHFINSLSDYALFRKSLKPGVHVAIIGAGLVGSEFANDLSHMEHKVTVVDMLPTPLGKLVPTEIGEMLRDALIAQGVHFHLKTSVLSVEGGEGDYQLHLSDRQVVQADIIISAIGLRPDISLAKNAGLKTDVGILIDEYGTTSDPNIYALGDCAQYLHGLSAYVTPIMTAARSVASAVLGEGEAMKFPPLSVQVKTTVCPIVLLPVPLNIEGEWVCEKHDGADSKYVFKRNDGMVFGYVMTGNMCGERMTLDREISAAMGGDD